MRQPTARASGLAAGGLPQTQVARIAHFYDAEGDEEEEDDDFEGDTDLAPGRETSNRADGSQRLTVLERALTQGSGLVDSTRTRWCQSSCCGCCGRCGTTSGDAAGTWTNGDTRAQSF